MFWDLLPAQVIGGQVCRLPPLSAEEGMDKKLIFDEKNGPTWPHEAELHAGAKGYESKGSDTILGVLCEG